MKKEIAQSNFLLLAASSSSSFVLLYKDDGTAAHTNNIPVQKNKREQQNCQQREHDQQQLRIKTAKETMIERESISLLMLDLTERDDFGEEIRSKDAKAESVGVVESQHTEDVSGNEEVSVELRNAHALLWLLHQLPPSQRPVAKQNGHVKRHHSHHDTVELRSCECHAQERKKEFFNLSRESVCLSILSKLSPKLHFS
jgi:hypothetical protein